MFHESAFARTALCRGLVLALCLGATQASAQTGSTFLFYHASTGAGALATSADGRLTTVRTYPAGSFATGWTHLQPLFYNASTGAGAAAMLRQGTFWTAKEYPAGTFAAGWTHIDGDPVRPLFYNAATGAAALGYDPTRHTYAPGTFSTGWTHVAGIGALLLFYNAGNGAGAIAQYTSEGGTGTVWPQERIRTDRAYAPGTFATGWTHVVAASGTFLFYNAGSGEAALGSIRATGFVTERTYPPGSLARGWTHVATGGGDILFYDARTGAAALAVVDAPAQSAASLRTVGTYAANGLAPGWTHILVTVDPPDVR